MKHFDVESTDSGKSGLDKILEKEYDLILLDLTMPGFSGFDVLKELDRQEKMPKNIFALTAMTLTDDQEKYLTEKGIKKILQKPVEIDYLCKEIEKLQIENKI